MKLEDVMNRIAIILFSISMALYTSVAFAGVGGGGA